MTATTAPTVQETAKTLKRNTEWLTARAVQGWVQANINYRFFHAVRRRSEVWKDRTGDCSDMAGLMQDMLKVNGIRSKIVHGWGTWTTTRGTERVKHDWLEATITDIAGNTAVLKYDGVPQCEKYEYVGEGCW